MQFQSRHLYKIGSQTHHQYKYKVMSLTQLTYSFNPVTGPEGRYVFFAK
jgi:hypothetical protein